VSIDGGTSLCYREGQVGQTIVLSRSYGDPLLSLAAVGSYLRIGVPVLRLYLPLVSVA